MALPCPAILTCPGLHVCPRDTSMSPDQTHWKPLPQSSPDLIQTFFPSGYLLHPHSRPPPDETPFNVHASHGVCLSERGNLYIQMGSCVYRCTDSHTRCLPLSLSTFFKRFSLNLELISWLDKLANELQGLGFSGDLNSVPCACRQAL